MSKEIRLIKIVKPTTIIEFIDDKIVNVTI